MIQKHLYWILGGVAVVLVLAGGAAFLLRSAPPENVGQETENEAENESPKADLIRVTNPQPNQEIESPLTITGEARGFWYFEASFPIKLLDANGNVVPTNPPYIMATGEWMTEDFVPFSATIEFTAPATETGTLVLQKDNPSGLPEYDDELRIPVIFKNPASAQNETMEVKAFFANSSRVQTTDEECTKPFPVTRRIPKTAGVAKAALEELLKGPTAEERAAGFSTSLPEGSALNSITISGGVATADFNATTESGGGSCSMAMRVAQIRETLLQFRTVTSVVISINGRTEDIFQP